MNAYLLGLLFALSSIGLFFILVRFIRPLVRALLHGRLNNYYLSYIRSSAKSQFDSAATSNNPDRAWAELIFAKVYEIGSSRIPYAKREQNLEYIKATSLASRKLAEELIKVLPKQNSNPRFQRKLACYICEVLTKLESSTETIKFQVEKNTDSAVVGSLSTAISAWVAGCVYLLLSFYVLGDFSPSVLFLSNIALYVLMVIPAFQLKLKPIIMFAVTATIAVTIIFGLGSFAHIRQSQTQAFQNISLDKYQNPNAKLSIIYPSYLTINDRECNGKKISILVNGRLTTPISFQIDNNQFYFLNRDCMEIIPQLEVSQPEIQAYEFYIAARDTAPFFSKTQQSVRIIPQSLAPSGKVDFALSDTFTIQLEQWFWNLLSNLNLQLSTIGALIMLFIISSLTRSRNS